MCLLKNQFHYINPNTQLALYPSCIGNCSSIEYIQWNIYQGLVNTTIQWTLFSPRLSSWFYGKSLF